MNSPLTDPYLPACASLFDTVDVSPQSSDASLRRFSQIKRKLPPSFRYSAAELEDPLAPVWELRGGFPSGKKISHVDRITLRPPTPSDDMRLNDSDSETEEKLPPTRIVHSRPRAHTVPSRRFTNLVRIPPPVVDLDLLTQARSSGALRPASLPHQTIDHGADPRENSVPDGVDAMASQATQRRPDDGAESGADIPPAPSSEPLPKSKKSFRKSAVSFIQRRKDPRGGRLSVTSISGPVTQPSSSGRKYSVVSMASTNASMISLSAFPRPPETPPPPVPALPSLPFNAPKPDIRSLHSYILHVDPPHLSPDVARGRDERPTTDGAENPSPLHVDAPRPSTPPPRTVSFASAKGKSPIPIISERRVPQEPHFDFGDPPDFDGFDQDRPPTRRQLETAAVLSVISESGVRVPFGCLWQDQKTIVCFIRHFWCPLCQDYMFEISRNVSAEVLQNAGVELVIISNGSYEMIKSYRRIFRTPFALYTDPTHQVYNALGMTLQTLEKGPRGSYVRHGLMSGIGMVVANAVKNGVPVWKDGGEISQLGGEFILGPGMTCSWVHRMRYTRNHVPILKVIEAAGVDMYSPLHRAASTTGGSFLGMSSEEESKWMERRRKVLKKLRAKKMSRRGGAQWIDTASTTTATTSKRSSGSSAGGEASQRTSVGTEEGGGSAGSSKRTSLANEATPSMCSWDPSIEQAVNVGLMGYEDAIIEEAEEEESTEGAVAETEAEQEPQIDEDSSETRSQLAPSEVLSDIRSEYTDSFISQDASEDESSATDFDSTTDRHSTAELSLDVLDSKIGVALDARKLSSCSSLGSGYDVVVDHHWQAGFFGLDKADLVIGLAISESSLGTVE